MPITLSHALEEFQQSMVGVKSESTCRWYRYTLSSMLDELGDVQIQDITTSALRRWRTALLGRSARWEDHPGRPEAEGGLSPETVRGHVRAARVFFNWLVSEGLLEDSPGRRLEYPRKSGSTQKKAINPDDALAMLKVADTTEQAIILFLADTGCRVGGLCGLKRENLDLQRKQATVVEKGRGGGKMRTVFFSKGTAQILDLYLSRRKEVVHGADHVFLGRYSKPFQPSGIYQLIKRVAKRASVTGRFNPHAFRHGWAKEALRGGADLGTVSQVLGHSSISVTHDFYSHWEHSELGDRQRQFSWIGRSQEKS